MRFQFFTIPVFDSERATEQLNTFLAAHVVVQVERELLQRPGGDVWAFCITYLAPGEAGKTTSSTSKGRIDYRDVLSPEEFAIYAKLRELRKTLSETHKVPAYTLFTNEQLAAIVKKRVLTKAALKTIEGVGDARIDKYADAFLSVLKKAYAEEGEGDAET